MFENIINQKHYVKYSKFVRLSILNEPFFSSKNVDSLII